MSISDQRLREACLAAEELLIADFPEPHEPVHEFSPEFERKMETLLRKQKHAAFSQNLRKAAGFFLAILVGCSLWLTVDVEARERFIGWVREQYDDFQTHYYFEGTDNADTADVEYVLTEVPEGYVLEDIIDMGGDDFITVYKNESGKLLTVGIYADKENANLFVKTDTLEEKQIHINETPATYYYSPNNQESSLAIWIDLQTNNLIFMDGWFSETELVKIAKSLAANPAIQTN